MSSIRSRASFLTGLRPDQTGVADNLAQRAEWTDEFFRSAFARPDFVGWHYCGLIDATNQVARKQDRQHSGLMDGFGNPYLELQQVLKAASRELYDIAVGLEVFHAHFLDQPAYPGIPGETNHSRRPRLARLREFSGKFAPGC